MSNIKQQFVQSNYRDQFLRIGSISGMHYAIPGHITKRVVIYGIGAPLPPDEGKLSDASTISGFDTDLYVPDYIGYGRSEGRFTPINCVKTFLYLYEAFSKGCKGTCNYTNIEMSLKYNEIHFMGRSFGGTYILLLPRFNKNINNICSIFPIVDWGNVGKTQDHPEETIDGFYKAMLGDGYRFLYRGIFLPAWKKHFEGKDDLNPPDNIRYLKTARVFIGHGKKDVNIYYGNSVNYYKKVLKTFPDRKNQFMLKLYPYGHTSETSNNAIYDYFKWVGVKKGLRFRLHP